MSVALTDRHWLTMSVALTGRHWLTMSVALIGHHQSASQRERGALATVADESVVVVEEI